MIRVVGVGLILLCDQDGRNCAFTMESRRVGLEFAV